MSIDAGRLTPRLILSQRIEDTFLPDAQETKVISESKARAVQKWPAFWSTLLGAIAATIPVGMTGGLRNAAAAEPERFVIYYGQDAAPEAFAPYRRAVLDADHHPPLAPLKARGIELFGYVSVGEADAARSYHSMVQTAGVLLGANPNWPGAHYVDLRKPEWRALLIDHIIPSVIAQGFDGLFLDTLDDAAFLESADPIGNRGMIEAGATLVRAIRARYPALPLMLNRAYEVAGLVANDLDSILAESLVSSYDFKTRRHHLRAPADLKWGMDHLAELRARNPRLRIYTVDYWDPSDQRGVAKLYEQERRAGFIPYVATIDLQRIVPEPRSGGTSRVSR